MQIKIEMNDGEDTLSTVVHEKEVTEKYGEATWLIIEVMSKRLADPKFNDIREIFCRMLLEIDVLRDEETNLKLSDLITIAEADRTIIVKGKGAE